MEDFIAQKIINKEREKSTYFQGVLDSIKLFGVFCNPKQITIQVVDCEEIMKVPFLKFGDNTEVEFRFSNKIVEEKK